MATKKISELEAINAAEDNDVLVIVDTSESTTNKITKGNLLIGAGHTIEMTLNENYQIVLVLKNAAGTALSTQTIDLPNENAVTNLAYNNGILTVTKQSGATSQINLTGLIEGLVTESDFNTFKEALQTTLEAINEKDAEQDEAIAENYKVINKLNEKLENQQKVIDQLPQVTEQGTEVTLENTIEATFTKFDVEGNSVQAILPEEYQQVDYIESTGTQYIDTGYTPVQGDNFEIKNVTTKSNGMIFYSGTGENQLGIFVFDNDGYYKYFATGAASHFLSPNVTNETIKIINGDLYYGKTLKAQSSYVGVLNTTLQIFRRPTGTDYISAEMGRFTITNGNAIKLDLIPCYKKSNNEIGFYDIINDEFYTNQGTGTFLKGNDVPNPNYEQPIYSAGDNENEFDIGTSIDDYDVSGTILAQGGTFNVTSNKVEMTIVGGGMSYAIRKQNLAPNETYSISGKASMIYSRIGVKLRSKDDTRWLDNNDTSIEGFTYNAIYKCWFKENNLTNFELNATIPDCLYWNLFIGFNSLQSQLGIVHSISDIKIEKGNKASGYSPYGMGSINEKIINKNYLPNNVVNQTKNGVTLVKNNDGTITANGTATAQTEILISSVKLSAGNYLGSIGVTGSTSTYYARLGEGTTSQSPFIANIGTGDNAFSLTESKTIGAVLIIRSGQTLNNVIFKPMIRLASITDNSYVPHEEQDYSIFVQQPMRSIGDVRDLFFKNVKGSKYYNKDLEENKWYERHYKRLIFDGTENWQFSTGSGVAGIYMLNPPIDDMVQGNFLDGLSNYFHNDKSGKGKNSIRFGANNNVIYIYVDSNEFPDKTSFTSWLAEKYASGHPLYIDYISAEPLDLPCTETQIQQLENKPSTYKDFTIIQSQDETPAYLEVSGIRDINTMFDKVTNAIVSLSGNV